MARGRLQIATFALAIGSTSAVFGDGQKTTETDDRFQMIVSPDLQIADVDRDVVRDIFLKKITSWEGRVAYPIQLTPTYAANERFTRDVLHKTPAQLKSYWSQQVFSGKGVPPPAVDSPAAVIAFVVENPGAIGYIPASVDPHGARVVRLK